MRGSTRLRVGGMIGLVVLLAGAWAGRSALGIEWSLESLRELVAGLGVWGPAVFVILLALRSVLFIPSQLLLIGAGVCFGLAAGTLYGAIGVTLSAALAFALARWLGREAILSQIPPRFRGILEGAGVGGTAAVVFIGTAYPVGPVSAYHAAAALTGMPAWSFVAAVFPGAAIRAGVYSAFGSRLGDGDLRGVLLAGGALLLLALPLALPRPRRWIFEVLGFSGRGEREGDGADPGR